MKRLIVLSWVAIAMLFHCSQKSTEHNIHKYGGIINPPVAKQWRETLLDSSQLLNGASGAILPAELFYVSSQSSAGNTFIVSNGTIVETYQFAAGSGSGSGTGSGSSLTYSVSIGASASEEQNNLVTAINSNSTIVKATATTGLGGYFAAVPAAQVVVAALASTTAPLRLYGTQTTTAAIKVSSFAGPTMDYTIGSGTESNLPATDPGAKRFGFGRAFANLQGYEQHFIASSQLVYDWKPVTQTWAAIGPPTHASSHQNGGADEIATTTPGPYAIPKAGSGSALGLGWIPAHASTHALAGSDPVRTTDYWTYLPAAQPTGMGTGAAGRWNFDGTANCLNDLTANGNNLTRYFSGSLPLMFQKSSSDLTGILMGSDLYLKSGVSSSLKILTDLTIEMIITPLIPWNGGDPINADIALITCLGIGSEDESANQTYGLYMVHNTGKLKYTSEHGSGVDDSVSFYAGLQTGATQLITLTRSSAGVLRIYTNGAQVGPDSAAITMPTGATGSEYFGFGMGDGESIAFYGIGHSLRITPAEFSAAQVLEVYNAVRGR